jgi:hypothetical protein
MGDKPVGTGNKFAFYHFFVAHSITCFLRYCSGYSQKRQYGIFFLRIALVLCYNTGNEVISYALVMDRVGGGCAAGIIGSLYML